MAIISYDDLVETSGPLLGLDPGTKTLGIAISDQFRLIASPLTTLHRGTFMQDSKELLKHFEDNNSSGLIVGLPLNMDGSKGPRAQSVGDFCRNLLKVQDIPIFFWDERMSTIAVDRVMLSGDMTRKKRAKNVDKLAATYILQGVLDRLRS